MCLQSAPSCWFVICWIVSSAKVYEVHRSHVPSAAHSVDRVPRVTSSSAHVRACASVRVMDMASTEMYALLDLSHCAHTLNYYLIHSSSSLCVFSMHNCTTLYSFPTMARVSFAMVGSHSPWDCVNGGAPHTLPTPGTGSFRIVAAAP